MSVYGQYLFFDHKVRKKYLVVGEYDVDYLYSKFHKYVSDIEIWKKAEVLLFNPNLPERDGEITLAQLKNELRNHTKFVEISTACFKGYFPQHTSKKPKNCGRFAWGDTELNRILKDKQFDKCEIDNLSSQSYFSVEKIKKHWDNSIHLLELMEKDSDVKISDYIREYGNKRVLYNSVTHPTDEVFEILLRRILTLLKCDSTRINKRHIKALTHHCEAIYPSVYYHLGILDDCEDRYFQPGIKGTPTYNFIQYVDEYLKIGMEQSNE